MMTRETLAPYGSWKSPITSDEIVQGSLALMEHVVDGEDVYLLEGRPQEGGRGVVVRIDADGQKTDVTPGGFNVRTRVHEYGGGAFTVYRGEVYFSNFNDHQVYKQKVGQAPEVLTRDEGMRYADFLMDDRYDRLICVRESHEGAGEAVNELVSINIKTGMVSVLATGADFYASPCLNAEKTKLAWMSWNHPLMPWDGSELWLADLDENGQLVQSKKVSGSQDESIFQPSFSPDGMLYFVTDKTNWWNLFRYTGERVEPVFMRSAEMGVPQWVFGLSTYGFLSAKDILVTYEEKGHWKLAKVDASTRKWTSIPAPYTYFSDVRVGTGRVFMMAASPTEPLVLVAADFALEHFTELENSVSRVMDPGYMPIPEVVEFPSEDGMKAHGIFYSPKNQDYDGLPDELPPLIVMSHGGPTSETHAVYNLKIAYWTSRGFAVLDVNYGGSTGYGRVYRERLKGNWGVVDVEDCVSGAKYLVERGDVDEKRLAIRGGSAGGYTTLCALAFSDVFKAGASYYGVSDAETLATDTHKFESRYTFGLIGPYPEMKELYHERSAIYHVDRLNCPVIFFQGLDDKIVLPDQSEKMYEALKAKGIPTSYVTFAGEGHGFRSAAAIKQTLENELYFYAQVFDFSLADAVAEVEIDNWSNGNAKA